MVAGRLVYGWSGTFHLVCSIMYIEREGGRKEGRKDKLKEEKKGKKKNPFFFCAFGSEPDTADTCVCTGGRAADG